MEQVWRSHRESMACLHRVSTDRRPSWEVALLLVLGLMVGAGPGHAEHTYRTTDDAIDIALPEGWQVDDSGIRGTLAVFYSNRPSYTAISLVSRRIASASLEQCVALFKERLRTETSQILEERRKRVGGEAAYEFRLVHTHSGEAGVVVITLFNNTEYTFALSAHDQQELTTRRPAFGGIISALRWRRPERVYRSYDYALTLDVPLQWSVEEQYTGKQRFVLIGPVDRGIANVIAVSRLGGNGPSLREFARQHTRRQAEMSWVSRVQLIGGAWYLTFDGIGKPPATQEQRHLDDRNSYVLERL